MRRFSTSLAVAVLAGLLVSSSFAQQASITTVPNLVRYGATLKDTQGAPVSSSTVGITFALYKQQDGGASIWMETQNVTTDTSGNYSVLLGSTTAAGLPSDLFSQQEQRWLDVQVEGQAEQPRVLLVSVPYAFKAHEAETLGGKSVSDFVLANGASSAVNGTANQASPSNANSLPTTAAGIRKGAASAGPTNFSGSTTDQIVQVTQTGSGAGIRASTSNTTSSSNAVVGTISGPGVAIYGSASSTSAQAYGVQGNSASTIGIGLLGFATSTTGSTYGLKGYSSSTGGTGVRGLSTATTGSTTGISASVASAAGTAGVFNNTAGGKILSGQNNGVEKFAVDGSGNIASQGTLSGIGITGTTSAATGVGLTGNATNTTGANTGVMGETASVNGIGVGGYANATTGQNVGVYGQTNSNSGWGVYGEAASTSGQTFGVEGNNQSSGSYSSGVLGYENAATGAVYGVQGVTASATDQAAGVAGNENAATGLVYGVVGITNSTTNSASGVDGYEGGASGQVYGVTGGTASSGAGAAGVAGYASSTTGQVYGVSGSTPSAGNGAAGIYGTASATSGYVNGVVGTTASSVGNGITGFATNTSGPNFGIQGFSFSTGGVGVSGASPGVGVRGQNLNCVSTCVPTTGDAGQFVTGTGGNILNGFVNVGGTWTREFTVDSSGDGYFAGNLNVTGTLTKGGGSFKIDDPLDPENKYLSHSFVESPDMLNLYNGSVRRDARGEAWVTMPEYYQALNRDFQYVLTSVGSSQPRLYIAREIKGNRFKIAGGRANGKASWMVTGIRQDAWANAHRIPTEEEKPPQERGKYLHPELYGSGADKNTNAMLQH
jgi:hypothetical protein